MRSLEYRRLIKGVDVSKKNFTARKQLRFNVDVLSIISLVLSRCLKMTRDLVYASQTSANRAYE